MGWDLQRGEERGAGGEPLQDAVSRQAQQRVAIVQEQRHGKDEGKQRVACQHIRLDQ